MNDDEMEAQMEYWKSKAEAAEAERHELKNKLAVQQNWQTLYEREKAENARLTQGIGMLDDEAESLGREADRLREALRVIAEWDCLNPPDFELCADHPWLKRHVDAVLGEDAE